MNTQPFPGRSKFIAAVYRKTRKGLHQLSEHFNTVKGEKREDSAAVIDCCWKAVFGTYWRFEECGTNRSCSTPVDVVSEFFRLPTTTTTCSTGSVPTQKQAAFQQEAMFWVLKRIEAALCVVRQRALIVQPIRLALSCSDFGEEVHSLRNVMCVLASGDGVDFSTSARGGDQSGKLQGDEDEEESDRMHSQSRYREHGAPLVDGCGIPLIAVGGASSSVWHEPVYLTRFATQFDFPFALPIPSTPAGDKKRRNLSHCFNFSGEGHKSWAAPLHVQVDIKLNFVGLIPGVATRKDSAGDRVVTDSHCFSKVITVRNLSFPSGEKKKSPPVTVALLSTRTARIWRHGYSQCSATINEVVGPGLEGKMLVLGPGESYVCQCPVKVESVPCIERGTVQMCAWIDEGGVAAGKRMQQPARDVEEEKDAAKQFDVPFEVVYEAYGVV